MLSGIKKILKAGERRWFRILKFDVPYKSPLRDETIDPSAIRVRLIDDYFDRQPNVMAVSTVRAYLFVKKAIKKLIRIVLAKG